MIDIHYYNYENIICIFSGRVSQPCLQIATHLIIHSMHMTTVHAHWMALFGVQLHVVTMLVSKLSSAALIFQKIFIMLSITSQEALANCALILRMRKLGQPDQFWHRTRFRMTGHEGTFDGSRENFRKGDL